MEPVGAAAGDCCNLGYARGRCPGFPADSQADAVRFSVVRHLSDVVTLCCAREKDHLPVDRTALVYSIPNSRFINAHPDPKIQDQARAYLESYLCRIPRSNIP